MKKKTFKIIGVSILTVLLLAVGLFIYIYFTQPITIFETKDMEYSGEPDINKILSKEEVSEDIENVIDIIESTHPIFLEEVPEEYYKEKEDKKRLEGNIYAGKVVDVLPGMQAAFVDIGDGKNAFLHIRDVLPKKSNITGNKEEDLEEYKIKDYIKPNQMLLLQVKKDATQIKGARVSTNIQIPGRFVVILPENNFITASQKIEDEKERNRLIQIAQKVKQE